MSIENVELMRECEPKHFRQGTVRFKYGKETEEESKQKRARINGKKYSRNENKEVPTTTASLLLEAVDRSPNERNLHLEFIHHPLGGIVSMCIATKYDQ